MCHNRHFNVKMTPGFLDSKIIICTLYTDKPIEASTQVTGFKIWPQIGILMLYIMPKRTAVRKITYSEISLYWKLFKLGLCVRFTKFIAKSHAMKRAHVNTFHAIQMRTEYFYLFS